MFKKLIPILIIAILGILDFALIGFAWQNPTQAPPGGNLTLPWIRSGTNVYLTNTSDNVGIGTTLPQDKLVVSIGTGEIRFGGANGRTLSAYNNGSLANFDFYAVQTYFNSDFLIEGTKKISTSNGSTQNLYLTTSDQTKAIYTDRNLIVAGTNNTTIAGNVGIGTTTPGEKLEVNGNIKAAAFYYGSDQSLKTNIKPFDKSLQKVLNLEPVYFDYKENNQHSLGFIAQDVEKQFPELVTTDSLTGLKSLDYSRLTAPLVMAIKEQQIQIESQGQQINELTKTIEFQQQQINELKMK